MTDTQISIAGIVAEWLDEEVQRLIRCGLTPKEAAKVHNRRMEHHRVLVLVNRLMNGLQ